MAPSKQIFAASALLGLAMAAPQQLDFNAANAAPAVAQAPAAIDADVDPAAQTATLYTSFAVPTVATAAATASTAASKAKRDVVEADVVERDLVERGALENRQSYSYSSSSSSSSSSSGSSYSSSSGSGSSSSSSSSSSNNGGSSSSSSSSSTSNTNGKTQSISSSSSNTNSGAQCGQANYGTTITSGTTYSLSGQGSGSSTHNVTGNINNWGNVIISQADYLKSNPNGAGQTCGWNGHDANNGNFVNNKGGLFQLNDYGATSGANYQWNMHSMNNTGTLQMCGNGSKGGCSYQLTSDLDSQNNGFISFEQTAANQGTSYWKSSYQTGNYGGNNLYNNGAFRLINTVFHAQQNIYGNGCWQVGKGGVLYLENGSGYYQNPNSYSTLPNQAISFQDSSAILHMEAGAYYYNQYFGPQLYGFGTGHAIEFAETLNGGSYSSSSGNLNLKFTSGSNVVISIGKGYNSGNFQFKKTPNGYNGVYYNGACPSQNQPSQCSSSAPTCSPVKPAPSTSTASTATTAAATTGAATTPAPTGTGYTPYYPALATSYTTDPALTATTTSGQACPTQPEAGTYCGFINPEDPCSPQPDGYGPVPSPDTDTAFLGYDKLHSLAQAAPTSVPSVNNTQYTEVFKDLNASTSANSYLGVYTLQSYDVTGCAVKCDSNSLCTAFNIYAERDPSLNPSKNDSTAYTVWGYYCPNPPSMTSFKCTLWGSAIDASTATNQGEYREDFHVVVTASNGYDRTNVATPPDCNPPSSSPTTGPTTTTTGNSKPTATPTKTPNKPWGHPHNCHGKGINAPSYHMGSRYFPGPYNPQVCSDYAYAQNSKNSDSGSSARCGMFNAAYYHKNGQPHGTYCSLYSSNVDDSYATYTGGNSGSDNYSCKQSWTYSAQY